jgi:hypothetical protein
VRPGVGVSHADARLSAAGLPDDDKPPHFPDPEASQQIHLDILADDIEVAEPKALALGANQCRPRRSTGSASTPIRSGTPSVRSG